MLQTRRGRPTDPVDGLCLGLAFMLAASFLASGCSGGGSSSPAAGPPVGLNSRVVVMGLRFPNGLPSSGIFETVQPYPGTHFPDMPVAVTAPPDGTNRIFVADRRGVIHVFDNDPSVQDTDVFLDLSDRAEASFGEEGLLGLAFDPEYATNGHLYVFYTTLQPERHSVISRFTASANNPNAGDADSELVLLEIPCERDYHKGGCLAFGPDGMLYISVGDDGDSSSGQDRTDLHGSILRLRPSDSGAEIPGDNPFVGAGGGVRQEIYAYGLRNPWRMSFDRLTGELWVGDVGDTSREEVDIVRAGDNLGWSVYEGTESFENPDARPASDFVAPIHDYGRGSDGGLSVIGGYVYRGARHQSLWGAYVYGDYAGNIWALRRDSNGAFASNTRLAFVLTLTSFGEDESGELLICERNGNLVALEELPDSNPNKEPPQRLSETGAFSDLALLTPTPGIIEYSLNAPQWADGARIRRWLALPGLSTIEFSAADPWEFPVATVLLLHLDLDVGVGVTRRMETRVLVHTTTGWVGSIYRWNEEQTDANLLEGDEHEEILVADASAPGGVRVQEWTFPGPESCFRCHTAPGGFVIGVKTAQLNGNFDYGGVVDNQLRSWNHIGLFSPSAPSTDTLPRLPAYDSSDQPLAARARAYLDVNCAHCHRPETGVPVNFDIRWEVDLQATNLLEVPAEHGNLGIPEAMRIAAGSKESSVLWERLRILDSQRMPPLGSHRVDAAGLELIGAWIDSLE